MAQDVVADMVGRLGFQVDEQGLQQFDQGMKAGQKSADGFGLKAQALGVTLGNLASQALSAAGDIAKAALAWGKDLTGKVAESSVEIDRAAKRLGVTRREIQELGGASSEVPKALEKLQEGLGELALRGSGPAETSLGALGLRLQDLEGKGPADQLRVLADAMRDLPSDSERTKVALELLGEEGASLLPALSQGAGGIDALIAKTKDLGVVLSDEAIDAGKDYARAMKELDGAWDRAAATAGTALLPVFTDLTRGAAEWFKENEALITQRLPEVIDQIVVSGGELIAWGQELAGGIENLTGLVTRMGEEGEAGIGGLAEPLGDLIDLSKDGIETFVEWTDDVAELADLVWDVGDAVKDGLVAAYEDYLEPVVDTVTDAFEDQESILGRVVTFVEGLVDRVRDIKNEVSEIVDYLGLGKAFDPSERRAIEDAKAAARAPVQAQRQAAEEERAWTWIWGTEHAERQAAEEERAYQERVTEHAERLIGEAKSAEETRGRRKRAEAYRRKSQPGAGGGGRVDTREAERLLGSDVRALAAASGANDKAVRAALESAAGELAGGASVDVARKAAAGVLGNKTGVDLSAQGGAEAALFAQLTQIGGASAARSATDGAKFVNIDQSVTVHVGGIALEIPESYAQALGSAEVAGGVEAAIVRALQERVFAPIVDAQAARSDAA